MKKILCLLVVLLGLNLCVNAANVVPDVILPSTINTYGVYQVGHSIVLYEEPDEQSPVKQKIVWDDSNVIPQDLSKANLFVVYQQDKDFALMSVTDETDEWVEVIYNNANGSRGWLKKDDPFKFNTWVNFYSMYGRKYGLKILKGAPQSVYNLYGSPEEGVKKISTINHPELINLNFIRGNWMLVTVVDADKTPKTGYIRWRSDNGTKYLFPNIK